MAKYSYTDKKPITLQSTKKNILEIINQSREVINRKQLLVSVINLKFALVFFPKVSLYGSSRFRIILPWGLQISDWHQRIQIKNLYPVTYDFTQRNQSFCTTKLKMFTPLQRISRSCPNKYKPRVVCACKARYANKAYKYGSSYKYSISTCKKISLITFLQILENKGRTNLRFVRTHNLRCYVRTRQTNRRFVSLVNKQIVDLYALFAKRAYNLWSTARTYKRIRLTSRNRIFVRKGALVDLLRLCNAVNKKHVWYAKLFVKARAYRSGLCFTKRTYNSYNHCRTRFKFCFAKMSQKDSDNIILSISGGQDSIFLLFCVSFLQSQITFKPKIIWCNHLWQKSSFYTTLHLTKSAMAFSSPIMGFLPFHMATSPQLYQTVTTSLYLGRDRVKKNQNKISTRTKRSFVRRSFFKKQSKQKLSTKNVFDKAKTKRRKKKPKAYKKFIKEISETRARNWRHITIERACTFYGSILCLNGHTLSDRVETILFNLIRGTKNKNFQTLPWKRRHSTFCYNKFYPTFEQVIKKTHIHFI